jgi:hypothetical protein
VALSPGIPTSFVPKQPVQLVRRPMASGNNLFLLVALAVAGLTIALAIGVFAYNKYLQHTLVSKQAQLVQAQGKVDNNTIEDFVRLRDRLSNGKDLLANHIVLSHFFDTLEGLTLQNVSFTTLKLSIAGDHTAKLQMAGTAKNFNALAAQSNAFAGEKRIKRAIFSDINLNSTKLVGFSLTADVDSKLIVEGSSVTAAPQTLPAVSAPVASSSPVVAPITASTTPVTKATAPKAPVTATTTP